MSNIDKAKKLDEIKKKREAETAEREREKAILKAKYADKRRCANIFFDNVKKDTIAFYNTDSLGIGFVKGKSIYNTSFCVGSASYNEKDGYQIWGGQGDFIPMIGVVTGDGYVYYKKDGFKGIYSNGKIISQTKANNYKIGKVQTSTSGTETIGLAFDLNGKLLGETRNAGDLSLLYAGAMLILVINHDEKNAPYSQSYCGFLIPAPPAPAPTINKKIETKITQNISTVNKILNFFKK